jgi:hypothetical protein
MSSNNNTNPQSPSNSVNHNSSSNNNNSSSSPSSISTSSPRTTTNNTAATTINIASTNTNSLNPNLNLSSSSSSSSSSSRPHSHPHHHVPGTDCCQHEYIELSGNVVNTSSLPNSTQGDLLLPYIDTVHVTCLNERIRDSCRNVFKGINDRTDKGRYMESDESDSELLFSIPFTASVRVRAICLSGGANGRTPSKLRFFINNPDADFNTVNESKPQQEILLSDNDPGSDIWHPLKPAKFHALSSLQIHCVGNQASTNTDDNTEDDVQIYFIGLKGDYLGPRATAPEVFVYESRPQLSDHKVKEENRTSSSLGL